MFIAANILGLAFCFVLNWGVRGIKKWLLSKNFTPHKCRMILGNPSPSHVIRDECHLVISARLQRVEKWADNEITKHSECQSLTGWGHPSPII